MLGVKKPKKALPVFPYFLSLSREKLDSRHNPCFAAFRRPPRGPCWRGPRIQRRPAAGVSPAGFKKSPGSVLRRGDFLPRSRPYRPARMRRANAGPSLGDALTPPAQPLAGGRDCLSPELNFARSGAGGFGVLPSRGEDAGAITARRRRNSPRSPASSLHSAAGRE